MCFQPLEEDQSHHACALSRARIQVLPQKKNGSESALSFVLFETIHFAQQKWDFVQHVYPVVVLPLSRNSPKKRAGIKASDPADSLNRWTSVKSHLFKTAGVLGFLGARFNSVIWCYQFSREPKETLGCTNRIWTQPGAQGSQMYVTPLLSDNCLE